MHLKLLLLCLVAASAYDVQKYSGYKIVNFWPKTREHVAIANKFAEREGVIVMKEALIGRQADYMVPQELFGPLKTTIVRNGMHYQIAETDVSLKLQEEWDRFLARGYKNGRMPYDRNDFNTRADIEAELDRLAGLCPATGLTCTSEFLSGPALYEGQRIKMFSLSGGANRRNSILWESMVHSREWLAGATLMNILDKMVTGYGTDPEVTSLIDNYDFYIIPMMNPDGYQYSWDNDRYWRKNRSPGTPCDGVDLNRNFDSNWSEPGASDNPCSETFYGPAANSEPETQTIITMVQSHTGPAWIMDISIHTYGYYLLAPYGNGTYPDNWNPGTSRGLQSVTNTGCAAIENTHNTNWDCGNSAEVLYETSGGSTDWMMETMGMPYTWVPELRGIDFVISPTQIPLSVEEVWNGFYAMVSEVMSYPDPK